MLGTRDYSRQLLYLLPVSFLIWLITYPRLEPDYVGGLDGSYMWALNWLPHHNMEALRQIVYPFGPLGFLKHPVVIGNNVAVSLAFFSVIKLAFIFQLLLLGLRHAERIKGLHIALALMAAYFANFDFSLIGSCVVSLLLFSHRRQLPWFVWAVLLAVTGLLVKLSIGVNAGSAVAVFLVADFMRHRQWRRSLLLVGVGVAVLLLAAVAVFQSLPLLLQYLLNTVRLATGFGGALGTHPQNNWWLLGGFMLLTLLFPLLVKDKQTRLAYLLLLFPLFATWKHGMARQDPTHVRLLVYFLFIFWAVLLVASRERGLRLFFVPVLSVLFFYANLRHVPGYTDYKVEIAGINNFWEQVLQHKRYRNHYRWVSEENLKPYVLDPELRSLIGDATIDFVPWELGFVPANNLNWKPRTTLQSGAYASWYDREQAANFTPQTGPEFVLLHLNPDDWGGRLGSFDNRHLLNDEPVTTFHLLSYYRPAVKRDNFWLLQKAPQPLLNAPATAGKETSTWNTWLQVPQQQAGVLRAKFSHSPNLLHALKSFLFKGEVLFIDYELDNGRILSYRFGPGNAQDGLWVNPLVLQPHTNEQEPLVTRIRFRSSNPAMFKEQVQVEWEQLTLAANPAAGAEEVAEALFNKTIPRSETLVLQTANGFEQATPGWSLEESNLTSRYAFSGSRSFAVPPNGFSATFALPADSIWRNGRSTAVAEADVWYRLEQGQANLIFGTDSEGSKFWHGQELQAEPGNWRNGRLQVELTKEHLANGMFMAYVWNTSSDTIFIDSFRIEIRQRPEADQ